MAVKPIRQVSKTITPANGNLVLLDDGVSMGKATLEAAVSAVAGPIVSGAIDDLGLGTAAQQNVEAFATAAQGAAADSAVQPGDLGAVATSNDYNDLSNKPTLGTAAATDASDYATAEQGSKADSALQADDIGVSVGDMLASAYDPGGVGEDVFDSANQKFENIGDGARAWDVQTRGRLTIYPQDYLDAADADYTLALQRIADLPGDTVCIDLPAGDYILTDEVLFQDKNLTLRGAGPEVTRILCQHADAKISFLDTETTNGAHHRLRISELSIIKDIDTTPGNGGTALDAVWSNTGIQASVEHATFDNLVIRSASSGKYWNKAMRLVDAGQVRWSNCQFYNMTTTDVSESAIELVRDSASNITSFFINNCYLGRFKHAIQLSHDAASSGAGTIEGIYVNNTEYVSVQKFIVDDATDASYAVNGVEVSSSHGNASRCAVDIGSLSSFLWIGHNGSFQNYGEPNNPSPLIAAVRARLGANVWRIADSRFYRNASVTDAAPMILLPSGVLPSRIALNGNSIENWAVDVAVGSGGTKTLDPARLLLCDNVNYNTPADYALGARVTTRTVDVEGGLTAVGMYKNVTNSPLQVRDAFGVARHTADPNGAILNLYKTRTATVGDNAALQSGDGIGGLTAYGNDGSGYINRAEFAAFAASAATTGNLQTYWRVRWSNGGESLDQPIYFGGPGMIQFGGQTSGHVGIRRNGANLAVRRSDDSGYAAMEVSMLDIVDGISAPSSVPGHARIYVDSADGDLKIIFGDGTVKTIVAD